MAQYAEQAPQREFLQTQLMEGLQQQHAANAQPTQQLLPQVQQSTHQAAMVSQTPDLLLNMQAAPQMQQSAQKSGTSGAQGPAGGSRSRGEQASAVPTTAHADHPQQYSGKGASRYNPGLYEQDNSSASQQSQARLYPPLQQARPLPRQQHPSQQVNTVQLPSAPASAQHASARSSKKLAPQHAVHNAQHVYAAQIHPGPNHTLPASLQRGQAGPLFPPGSRALSPSRRGAPPPHGTQAAGGISTPTVPNRSKPVPVDGEEEREQPSLAQGRFLPPPSPTHVQGNSKGKSGSRGGNRRSGY